MSMKTIVRQTLPRKQLNEMKRLTKANLGMKMLNIFSKHIGSGNAISRGQLFKQLFGRTEEPSLADELRWDYAKKAMHLLRQRTKCFVGSMRENGVWKYFVIKDNKDAQYYIDILDKNIKRMKVMQKKAKKAVDQKWYSLDWQSEGVKKLR